MEYGLFLYTYVEGIIKQRTSSFILSLAIIDKMVREEYFSLFFIHSGVRLSRMHAVVTYFSGFKCIQLFMVYLLVYH